MATEFVRRDELAAVIAQLIGRLDRIDTNIAALRGDMTILQATQVATRTDINELATYVHEFRGAVEASHRDLSKQVADGYANLQEQINDLKK